MSVLITNTMRYGFDTFTFNKSGLIYPKSPLDCTALTQVDGFDMAGAQPAGSNRRVAFQVEGAWVKLTAAGAAEALPTQAVTADSVLAEGNTVDELAALTSIPTFVGKAITPAVAMISPPDAEAFPTLKLSIKGKSNQDQFTKTEQSPEYVLSAVEDVSIIDASAVVETASGGSVLVEASVYASGAWSEYMPVGNVKGKSGGKIKFKATYAATTLGVSQAKVTKVAAIYKTSGAAVSGMTADIVTITKEFEIGMRYIRALVKHDALRDSTLKAYASFRNPPQKREKYLVGAGNGERQVIALPDSGVNHNTLAVWCGNQQNYNFGFNLETNQITATAPKDASIYVSYSYNWGGEQWVEMARGGTYPYQRSALYSTNFTYAIPDNEDAKGVCALKFVLQKTEGKVTEQLLGAGTGGQQMFVLAHMAKAETIRVPGASFTIDDNNILTVVAPKGREVRISYEWISETPIVHGYLAAWNE